MSLQLDRRRDRRHRGSGRCARRWRSNRGLPGTDYQVGDLVDRCQRSDGRNGNSRSVCLDLATGDRDVVRLQDAKDLDLRNARIGHLGRIERHRDLRFQRAGNVGRGDAVERLDRRNDFLVGDLGDGGQVALIGRGDRGDQDR